jgi:flagellar basal body-associated protein FliL
MSAMDTDAPSSANGPSDWLLESVIGVGVIVLGLCVWVFTHFSNGTPHQDKPKPTWLAVSKVMAQMSDGRMVNIKVNLRVANDKAIDQLEPHVPAFKALIQETGTRLSKDDLQGTQGMKNFSRAIRASLNDYLQDRQVPARVKDVAFEEMMLMP